MNEQKANEIIFSILKEYRVKIKKSWFIPENVKLSFLYATSEYWMIGRAFDVIYGNGLPHDINTSEGKEKQLYINLQKEIVSIEGMYEYLESERIRITNENLIRRSMSELTG